MLTILLLGVALSQQPAPAPSCKPPLIETVTKAGNRTCAPPVLKSKAKGKKKGSAPKQETPKVYTVEPTRGDVLPRTGSRG